MKNSDAAIGFLGYTSIHEPLDDYLLSINIKKRPKDTSLSTRIVEGDGISFLFLERPDYIEIYDKDPLSAGQLVLERVDFDREGNTPLPFGLDYSMSLGKASTILGTPLKSVMPEVIPAKPWMPKFHFKNLLIVLHFEKESMAMKHAVVTQLSVADQKRYGIR